MCQNKHAKGTFTRCDTHHYRQSNHRCRFLYLGLHTHSTADYWDLIIAPYLETVIREALTHSPIDVYHGMSIFHLKSPLQQNELQTFLEYVKTHQNSNELYHIDAPKSVSDALWLLQRHGKRALKHVMELVQHHPKYHHLQYLAKHNSKNDEDFTYNQLDHEIHQLLHQGSVLMKQKSPDQHQITRVIDKLEGVHHHLDNLDELIDYLLIDPYIEE